MNPVRMWNRYWLLAEHEHYWLWCLHVDFYRILWHFEKKGPVTQKIFPFDDIIITFSMKNVSIWWHHHDNISFQPQKLELFSKLLCQFCLAQVLIELILGLCPERQWELPLQSNLFSYCLGTNLESALWCCNFCTKEINLFLLFFLQMTWHGSLQDLRYVVDMNYKVVQVPVLYIYVSWAWLSLSLLGPPLLTWFNFNPSMDK